MSAPKMAAGSIPLRERRSLAEEWDNFSKALLANAPEVQRTEMRRAFYAGAQSFFGLISGGLDPDHEPTELDVEYVEGLNQELRAFGRDVSEGRA